MSGRRSGYGAVAAVVTAAALVLTGCGGEKDDGAEAGRSASPGGPAPEGPQAAPGSAGPDADAVPSGPKEPLSELSPASGSFTKQQKEYLTGRVPEGNDPAAVLQAGQETCDRMAYLARQDEDMAVGAIVTGEVTGASAAVTHLCPERKPLLDAARQGFADGTFRVAGERKAGKAVAPGRYRAPGPGKGCVWRIEGAGGKELKSGGWKKGAAVPEVTIPESARGFVSSGCYAWLSEGGGK